MIPQGARWPGLEDEREDEGGEEGKALYRAPPVQCGLPLLARGESVSNTGASARPRPGADRAGTAPCPRPLPVLQSAPRRRPPRVPGARSRRLPPEARGRRRARPGPAPRVGGGEAVAPPPCPRPGAHALGSRSRGRRAASDDGRGGLDRPPARTRSGRRPRAWPPSRTGGGAGARPRERGLPPRGRGRGNTSPGAAPSRRGHGGGPRAEGRGIRPPARARPDPRRRRPTRMSSQEASPC